MFDKYTSDKTDAETEQPQGRRKGISKNMKVFQNQHNPSSNKEHTSVVTIFPKSRQHNQENTQKSN